MDAKSKILLVEDNPADQHLFRKAVEVSGAAAELDVVDTGEKALDYLRRDTGEGGEDYPDLLLLDLNLPGKHGREVLQEIKTDEKLKRIPVIIFTSSSSRQDLHTCYGLHANGYMLKPSRFAALVESVKMLQDFWFTCMTLPPSDSSMGF